MESSSMSSQPPTSWRNSSEYWTEGWLGEGRKAGRHQTSGWRGYEEDPSQCVSFTPFPAGAAHGLLSLPVPGQLTAQFFLSFLPSPPLQAETSGSPSHFTVGSWYGRLDCWQLGEEGLPLLSPQGAAEGPGTAGALARFGGTAATPATGGPRG